MMDVRRTDDGRTPARSSTCEPSGSGELIKSTSYTADNNCAIYKYSKQVHVFKRKTISNKSYKINTMQVSLAALSLAFCLVSNSYKLSVMCISSKNKQHSNI